MTLSIVCNPPPDAVHNERYADEHDRYDVKKNPC